jgi:hypothetical protein
MQPTQEHQMRNQSIMMFYRSQVSVGWPYLSTFSVLKNYSIPSFSLFIITILSLLSFSQFSSKLCSKHYSCLKSTDEFNRDQGFTKCGPRSGLLTSLLASRLVALYRRWIEICHRNLGRNVDVYHMTSRTRRLPSWYLAVRAGVHKFFFQKSTNHKNYIYQKSDMKQLIY